MQLNHTPVFNNVLFIISINYINQGRFLTGINIKKDKNVYSLRGNIEDSICILFLHEKN